MKVNYSIQRTINLGNFENVKIDIGVEAECEDGELKKTYENVRKFVNRKIEEEMQEWVQE
jgi:hypothetical protein